MKVSEKSLELNVGAELLDLMRNGMGIRKPICEVSLSVRKTKRKRRRHIGARLPKESCWGGGRSWLGGVDRLANGLRSNRSGNPGLKNQLMSGFWAAEHL
jgi:hypothetical protein